MEALNTFENWVSFYQTTQGNIPENSNHHNYNEVSLNCPVILQSLRN